jgi:hypothetical protein
LLIRLVVQADGGHIALVVDQDQRRSLDSDCPLRIDNPAAGVVDGDRRSEALDMLD